MDGFQWTEFILRFPHLAEKIFEGLDDQSLATCRLVEESAGYFLARHAGRSADGGASAGDAGR